MSRFSRSDIQFFQSDTLDFNPHDDMGCASVTEYLIATDKLCELLRLHEIAAAHDIDLSVEDKAINFYFTMILRDWSKESGEDKTGSRFIQAVIYFSESEVQAAFESELGTACPIISISSEEADQIQEMVAEKFGRLFSDITFDAYLQECRDEIKECE